MPKISLMTMVLGSLPATDVLATLARKGFDGVELPSTPFIERPGLVTSYQAVLEDTKLLVTCMDGSCNFVAATPADRRKGVDALLKAIEVAAQFKCPLVLAAGSHLSDGISPADGRGMIINGLQACMSTAREMQITLAIENFGVAPTLQCAASDCLEILDTVPGLAFVFDTGNFYFCQEDPLVNMKRLASKTRHVHVKDWIRSDTPDIADVAGAALGTGIIPNEQIVRWFAEDQKGARKASAPPLDSFSLEVGAPGDKLEAAKKDFDVLRRWLDVSKGRTVQEMPS